jgi:L-lactate dehydrogenase complex protein LldG
MTPAKQDILQRIRAALNDHPTPPPIPRNYHRTLPEGTDLITLFAQRAADYRATITRTPNANLPHAIAEAAAGRRLATPTDLPAEWTTHLDTIADNPPLTSAQLDHTDGVLTGAATAIALTGTIILDTGPTQGRRTLTLLPDYHLCVLHTHQIVGTLTEALTRLDPTRPQTWISGPSATSDIELNRIEGVHGPRTLHIIIAE